MRILLWHGYLLGGTGSNVYTRMLAREWSNAGHDVTVLSQEPTPSASTSAARRPCGRTSVGSCPCSSSTATRATRCGACRTARRAELDTWVEANARRIRALLPADVVFTNHVLLGGPVGAATGAPFAVKAHGSELEYSMRGNPELSAWGAEALAAARATFVGSDHIRTVLREVCGHTENVFEVPPGVDIDEWVPEPRDVALAALLEEARRDPPNPGNAEERLPDEGNADRLERFLAPGTPVVVYFGKLIEQKGVHVLIEALAGLEARLVVVGFGPERAALEALAADRGVEALFTGPLEHRHLRHLLALADACVVPSIFPEAFGMVAAEAAAAGCPPLVARHSGLAEVAAGLEEAYPPELGHLAAFDTGDAAGSRAAARRAARAVAVGPRFRPSRCPRRRGRALELGRGLAPPARAVRLSRSAQVAIESAASTTLSRSMGDEQRVPTDQLLRDARERFEEATDFTVAVEEEFALLDPVSLDLVNRFEDVQARRGRHRGRAAPRRRADRVRGRDQDRQGRHASPTCRG